MERGIIHLTRIRSIKLDKNGGGIDAVLESGVEFIPVWAERDVALAAAYAVLRAFGELDAKPSNVERIGKRRPRREG